MIRMSRTKVRCPAFHNARQGRGGDIKFVGLDLNTCIAIELYDSETIGLRFAEMRKLEHCNIEKPNMNNERSIQRMWQEDTEEIIILTRKH